MGAEKIGKKMRIAIVLVSMVLLLWSLWSFYRINRRLDVMQENSSDDERIKKIKETNQLIDDMKRIEDGRVGGARIDEDESLEENFEAKVLKNMPEMSWNPWSRWASKDNTDFTYLHNVDLNDTKIDVAQFEKLYKKGSSGARFSCLTSMMLFELTHNEGSVSRSVKIQNLFRTLVECDSQWMDELKHYLAERLQYKGIYLEKWLDYEAILNRIEKKINEKHGQKYNRYKFMRRYGSFLISQLHETPDGKMDNIILRL